MRLHFSTPLYRRWTRSWLKLAPSRCEDTYSWPTPWPYRRLGAPLRSPERSRGGLDASCGASEPALGHLPNDDFHAFNQVLFPRNNLTLLTPPLPQRVQPGALPTNNLTLLTTPLLPRVQPGPAHEPREGRRCARLRRRDVPHLLHAPGQPAERGARPTRALSQQTRAFFNQTRALFNQTRALSHQTRELSHQTRALSLDGAPAG